MENFMESLKRWKKNCFEGEVTMPKVTFWLAAAVCLLAGVVFGLLAAPMTDGVHRYVGCNNGNNNGNANSYSGGKDSREKEGEQE